MKKSIFIVLLLCANLHIFSMDKKVNNFAKQVEKTRLSDPESSDSESEKKLSFPRVHFSPGIGEVLTKFIHDEQKQMRGAWFRFTLYEPAKQMAKRIKKHSVRASLVVDESNIKDDFCSPLKLIIDNGGKVYKKNSPRNSENAGLYETMHHKFMIFDKNIDNKKLLWTGSFNATGQADLKNCENAMIIDDPETIEQFEQEFATVLKYSTKLKSEQCVNSKDSDPSKRFAREMNGIPEPKIASKKK